MKLSATAAALFVWLQFAPCATAFAEALPQGDGHCGKHRHAQSADANLSAADRDAGVPHPNEDTGSCEDHCDLVSRMLVTASPTVAPPSLLVLPASISLQASGVPIVSLSVRRSLQAPPRQPDLILQNASFLL